MNKLAIITGASKGVGAAAASRFIELGYDVLCLSRSTCSVAGVESLPINLSQPSAEADVSAWLAANVTAPTQICLVQNAATLAKDSITSITSEALNAVLQLNVTVPAMLNRVVLPYMDTGSSIVYVGSTLSRKAVANSFSYVTSKHALMGMMRASCQDLAGDGIHTAIVMPGFTDTEMLRSHIGQDEAIVQALAANVCLGRLIEPQEIATVITVVAQNPVLNGAEIDANLGQVEH